MKRHLMFSSLLLLGFSIILISTAVATPFTDAVQTNDAAALDSLLATENAVKQMNRKDDDGNYPIHYAVNLGLRSIVSKLVQAGAELDVEDSFGRTPLHLASAQGDAEVSGYLLRHGALVSAADDAGLTALHFAVSAGSAATMDTLRSWDANVDALSDRKHSPLALAVLENQPEMIDKLLTEGANANLRDKTGMSPLHHAVVADDAALVTLFLTHFADINLLTGTGLPDAAFEEATALHLAIAFDHGELAALLIEAGASTSIANRNGDTPLMLAIRQAPGSFVIRLLVLGASLENPDGEDTPLSLAVTSGDATLIGTLIDHGADLNVALPSDEMPILAAVAAGHTELVVALLQRGANADTTVGETYPLELALAEGYPIIAQELLEAGANPNRIFASYSSSAFSKAQPRTALSLAVKANSLPLTQKLLDHGADVNLDVSEWEQTLLEIATKTADLRIVRLLVAEGAKITVHGDLADDAVSLALDRGYPFLRELLKADGFDASAKDREGNNYLHLATDQKDDVRLIRALANAGVSITESNADGRTPLHEAARQGNAGMTRSLLGFGADASVVDSDGKTPLDLARGTAKAVLLSN